MNIRAALASLVPVLLLAGCGDDTTGGGGEGGGGEGGAGGGSAVVVPELDGWTEFQPGGDSLCSRGTPYSFWARGGTSNKVVIDFIGGGACWNEQTCGFAGSIFEEDVESVRQRIESGVPEGIYDNENPDNPFADYFHVVVPYCTGDIHWGDNDVTYGEGENAFTIHHRGAVNARAVLDWVYENFSAPEEILVTGCSAGAYGSALWSAHIREHYPEAKVFQFGDSGAGIITQTFFEESFPSWNADQAFPTWIPALDPSTVNILEMALNDLYVGIANHYADEMTMSQYNTVFDDNQTFYFTAMGGSGVEEWSQLMLASVGDIEERADNFASYIAPGEQHCIIPYDNFYTVTSNGNKLTDWLRATRGGALDSVMCEETECSEPTP